MILYQEFSKNNNRQMTKSIIVIVLISLIEFWGLYSFGASGPLAMFISLGCFLMISYSYLRYCLNKVYEDGPYKIFVKKGDILISLIDEKIWSVLKVDKKELFLSTSTNESKVIHWKELDNFKLKV